MTITLKVGKFENFKSHNYQKLEGQSQMKICLRVKSVGSITKTSASHMLKLK